MTMWQQLVQQGILGTSRQPTLPPLDPSLALLWSQVSDLSVENLAENKAENKIGAKQDGEERFLQMAAILTQYEVAGRIPEALPISADLHETKPAPLEFVPSVTDSAAALLRQLIVEFDLKLIIEWLTYAAKYALHLPPEILPLLLDRARKERALATALSPCLGERGRWLLMLNPSWQSTAFESVDEERWQIGNAEERMAYLFALREAAPDRARDALAMVWEQEAAAERSAFLATLRVNLSMADGPLLETAMIDRSQYVRTEALRLLAALPDSSLRSALLTQITTYVTVERGWLQQQLVVNLPSSFTQEWKAWGIREQSPLGVRIGQKAGWLVQLVSLVPPSALVEALAVDAVELLELVRASDYAEALVTALLEGAEQHRDFDFLLAELHHLLRLLELAQISQSEFIERFARYAPTLPMGKRLTLVRRYLNTTGTSAFGDWATLQMVLRHVDSLSPAITTQLLTQQLPTLLQRNTRDYGVGRTLLDLAYQLAPVGYSQAETLLQHNPGEERPDYIERFLQIYGLRWQMMQAFEDG